MRLGVKGAGAAAVLAVSACHGAETATPDQSATTHAFIGIGTGETVNFTGTEPFWSGSVKDGQLNYATPENPSGQRIPVQRFAGNAGLGFSGTMDGRPLDMAVTRGSCSDGMSDRTYPFTVTLRIGEDTRKGCAWTDSHPLVGPAPSP